MLALAACNKQAPGGNGAAGNPAAGAPAAPAAVTMRPGQWETTLRVVSISAPAAPPEVQQQLQAAVSAAPVTERSCLTPAEAADPAASFRDRTAGDQPGMTCQIGESLFAGGRIRLTLTCRSSTGQPEQRQAMAGTYTSDTVQAAVSGETSTPASETMQSFPVRVESTLIGRRTGDCTGTETD
jgi:hypothetical protein